LDLALAGGVGGEAGRILRNHLDDVGGGLVELERRRRGGRRGSRQWQGKVVAAGI